MFVSGVGIVCAGGGPWGCRVVCRLRFFLCSSSCFFFCHFPCHFFCSSFGRLLVRSFGRLCCRFLVFFYLCSFGRFFFCVVCRFSCCFFCRSFCSLSYHSFGGVFRSFPLFLFRTFLLSMVLWLPLFHSLFQHRLWLLLLRFLLFWLLLPLRLFRRLFVLLRLFLVRFLLLLLPHLLWCGIFRGWFLLWLLPFGRRLSPLSFPPSSSFLSLPSSSSHRVFKQVVSLITGFFPAAKPKDVKPADLASWFEGFGDVKRCDPRFFLFFLFNKLRSIKVEVDSKVQKSAHNRKKAIGVLPSWGDVYHVSDLPEFHKAPPLNKQFSRLLDKMVASSRFMSMSIEECMKLESLVGVMPLSTDNQRLSVAQVAGVERQGCGSLGSGGLAFGISHSLSCGPHTIQGTHPLSFVLPLVHQGQSTGCGSAISCRGGSSGACSSSVSVALQPFVCGDKGLRVLETGHQSFVTESEGAQDFLQDGDSPVGASLHHAEDHSVDGVGSSCSRHPVHQGEEQRPGGFSVQAQPDSEF